MSKHLYFYQHSRQSYASSAPFSPMIEDDFLISGEDTAEFKIEIVDLRGQNGDLSPHLCTYDDGLDALRKFISLGGLNLLGAVQEADEFNRRLQALGIEDRSDNPLEVAA